MGDSKVLWICLLKWLDWINLHLIHEKYPLFLQKRICCLLIWIIFLFPLCCQCTLKQSIWRRTCFLQGRLVYETPSNEERWCRCLCNHGDSLPCPFSRQIPLAAVTDMSHTALSSFSPTVLNWWLFNRCKVNTGEDPEDLEVLPDHNVYCWSGIWQLSGFIVCYSRELSQSSSIKQQKRITFTWTHSGYQYQGAVGSSSPSLERMMYMLMHSSKIPHHYSSQLCVIS